MNYEAPVPCEHCGEIFELCEGYPSTKWYKNIVICVDCHEKEENEIDLQDDFIMANERITAFKDDLEGIIEAIKDCKGHNGKRWPLANDFKDVVQALRVTEDILNKTVKKMNSMEIDMD